MIRNCHKAINTIAVIAVTDNMIILGILFFLFVLMPIYFPGFIYISRFLINFYLPFLFINVYIYILLYLYSAVYSAVLIKQYFLWCISTSLFRITVLRLSMCESFMCLPLFAHRICQLLCKFNLPILYSYWQSSALYFLPFLLESCNCI